jgi:hypothetical protein
MWGGKFWRIGEAARSCSSIELEAVRVGGAAWRFPRTLQKGIEDAIQLKKTFSTQSVIDGLRRRQPRMSAFAL